MNKGKLILYTGSSGVGKGTIIKQLLESDDSIKLSVSATTRSPRPGEQHGKDYYFLNKAEFEQMIKEEGFLEYASYCDNYYGTPKKAVEKMLSDGFNVILEIEVQGGLQILEKCPDCTSIFIMPPSVEELEKRLRGRGTETEDVILKRLDAAKGEMKFSDKYDYVVINDDVNRAAEEILSIIHNN